MKKSIVDKIKESQAYPFSANKAGQAHRLIQDINMTCNNISVYMMYAIGIDIGGTKIEGSIIDDKGNIHINRRTQTEAEKGKEQILSNLADMIKYLKENSKRNIKGVGISIPGFIDNSGKMVFGGGTLTSLIGVNLKKELEKRVKLPVFLENDANCFALAEAVYGAGKGYGIVFGIIWGTGIGGGIIINRHIYSGTIGGAGEFGHIVIDPTITKGPKCGCGQYACLEMLTSGKNISRIYTQNGGKIKDANPRQIYDSKEKTAQKILADAIHNLGIGISTLVNVLNPDIIVIGGGVSQLPSPVYTRLEKEVKRFALPVLTKNLKIVRHRISDSAGLLGAAALVFENKIIQ